jgi:hypothetical protein
MLLRKLLEGINKRQGSLVNISLEHILNIYSKEEIDWRISWMHKSFRKSEILTEKVLKV